MAMSPQPSEPSPRPRGRFTWTLAGMLALFLVIEVLAVWVFYLGWEGTAILLLLVLSAAFFC